MIIQNVPFYRILRWCWIRTDFFRLKAASIDEDKIIHSRNLEPFGEVQRFIDSECLRLSAPLVPKDNNILIESGNAHTKIGSGKLEYRTVYARRWYYMPACFQEAPERGNYWFERMKQQYKDQILAGAQRKANGG